MVIIKPRQTIACLKNRIKCKVKINPVDRLGLTPASGYSSEIYKYFWPTTVLLSIYIFE